MARLEAFLSHTKQEIKKYAKNTTPDIELPNQNSNDSNN